VTDSDLTVFPYVDVRLKCPTAKGGVGGLSSAKGKYQSEVCAFE
jgi:hypothetical protein